MSEAKKHVCLGMPTYGDLTALAARGFYRPSAGGLHISEKIVRPDEVRDVSLMCQQSSLLALNCNVLWCWALNRVHNGERVDYWALQHSDIEPQDFWLDAAIDELEANQLDVLGVVSPIKDQRGVTSIALGSKDGNNWRPHGRLTMKEIFRLPETFTSKDLGYDLLINTGCMVVKWNQDWCKKIHFTINDRIAFDPKKGVYFAQVEPEDWFVSRLFHEQGLKVGCTRKIKLGHRGPMSFGNTEPWGKNDYDTEYLERSILDREDSASWFPHFAAGWLTEDEGIELAKLADGKSVLEIGSYCGRSTICLAQKAKHVHAVDTFDGRGTPSEGDTFNLFRRNLIRYGVDKTVTVLRGTSSEILPNMPRVFDLVFIDGSHDYESVNEDIELSLSVLRPNGVIAFHDYGRSECNLDVTRAVDEFIADGAQTHSRAGHVLSVRPSAEQLARTKLELTPA